MKKQHSPKARQAINVLELNHRHHQFDYQEVYRSIRTNIEFSSLDASARAIALTSCQPFEAKTTTALNLAFIFAMKYARVLLIDCDLRQPQIHKYLKLSNRSGLTDTLLHLRDHDSHPEKAIQKYEHTKLQYPLHVLTSGTLVPNPAEILSSQLFKKLIADLKERYDFLLLDCPPILSVSDAVPIGRSVDGTLFILSTQDTTRRQARLAISILKQNNVHLLGTIMTKVPLTSQRYGYGYY